MTTVARILLALTGLAATASAPLPALAADDKVDFARDVLPLLSDNCFHCHGPDASHRKAKLRLDTKDGAFRVKDGVATLVAGKPEVRRYRLRYRNKENPVGVWSDVTVTVSATSPAVSTTSSPCTCSARTTTLSKVVFLKPAFSTVKVYVPGGSWLMR